MRIEPVQVVLFVVNGVREEDSGHDLDPEVNVVCSRSTPLKRFYSF